MQKDYVQILDDAVTEAKEHLEFIQGKHDRHAANSQTNNPHVEPLRDAKQTLKVAQERLTRGRKLVEDGAQRKVEELNASVSSEAIAAALLPVQELMHQSAWLALKAAALRVRIHGDFQCRAREAASIEHRILDQPDQAVDYRRLGGFTQFQQRDLTPEEIIGELERIVRVDDNSCPIRDLLARDGNRLTIAGQPARDFLSFAGLA
jgi:hypothetical protein